MEELLETRGIRYETVNRFSKAGPFLLSLERDGQNVTSTAEEHWKFPPGK